MTYESLLSLIFAHIDKILAQTYYLSSIPTKQGHKTCPSMKPKCKFQTTTQLHNTTGQIPNFNRKSALRFYSFTLIVI